MREKLYGKDDWRSAETALVGAEIDVARSAVQKAADEARAARGILVAQRGEGNPLVAEADQLLRSRDAAR